MTALEIKTSLHQSIEKLDENFLRAVYAMVETYTRQETIIGYQMDGQPLYVSDLEAQIERGEAQIERGEYLTTKELKQELQTWRNTK